LEKRWIIKKKIYLLGLLFASIITTNVYGHGPEDFSWTTISTFGLYDSRNGKILPSLDINSTLMFFNGGLNYKNFTYIDSNKFTAYLGLGFGSFIQLQAGYSFDGYFSIRNRYDIPLGLFLDFLDEDHPYLELITISAMIEKYINNPQKNWYFGVGVGFSINNFYGIKYFKD
jgi:hypothetical protein